VPLQALEMQDERADGVGVAQKEEKPLLVRVGKADERQD